MRRIYLWASAFFVVGLVIVLGVSLWGRDEPGKLGMFVHVVDSDSATIAREFDLMAKMQVAWVRSDFQWPLIEFQQGEFDWALTDEVVQQASSRGMNVLGVLSHTPDWARGAGTGTAHPPDDIADFARFARAAAARYAPQGVHTWEIWNEPNHRVFWNPAPDADHYGRLFRATAEAMREVDPKASLLIGGLSPGTDLADGSRISQLTVLKQLYANGTAQLADAVAIHPYTFPLLPTNTEAQVVGGINEMPALHELMEQHGDGAKKIWITEFGAPTGTSHAAVTDQGQVATIMHGLKLVEERPWAGPLIIYELRDGGTNPAVNSENFGMVRRDFSLKPAAKYLMGLRDP